MIGKLGPDRRVSCHADNDYVTDLIGVINENTQTTFVVAAGNDGEEINGTRKMYIPAALSVDLLRVISRNVITVGSVNYIGGIPQKM